MRRTLFNDGWSFRPKAIDRFAEMMGAGGRVDPGHPAPRRDDRHASGRRTPGRPRATSLVATGSTAGPSSAPRTTPPTIVLEFEGVYRDAVRVRERHRRRPPPVRATRTSSCRSTTCSTPGRERDRGRGAWPTGTPAGTRAPASTATSGSSEARPVHLAPDGLHGPHARGRRRRRRRGGRRRRAERVARTVAGRRSGSRCSTPTARSSREPTSAGHHVPRRRRSRARHRLLVGRPRTVGAWTIRTSTRAGSRLLDGRRRRRRGVDHVRHPDRWRSTPRAACASTASRSLLRGACVHHDNGVLGAATIDRAEERRVELLQGRRLQRHPQRAQPA